MIAVLKILKGQFLKGLYAFLEEYMKVKYGPKSCLCIVEGQEDQLSFYTRYTHGISSVEKANTIRSKIGQNLLLTYGLPADEADVPVVMLLVTPSAIMLLKERAFKFIKDWRGDSKVDEHIVVKYITP